MRSALRISLSRCPVAVVTPATRASDLVSLGTIRSAYSSRRVSPSRRDAPRSSFTSGRETDGKRTRSVSRAELSSRSRSARVFGEQLPRSSDSIRAMLKSVFLIRASLVIPNVSLNLPKDELLAIYMYCAYTHIHMYACVCTHTRR